MDRASDKNKEKIKKKRKEKKRDDSPHPSRVDGTEAVVRMFFFLRLSLIGDVRVLSTYGRRWRLFWGHPEISSFTPFYRSDSLSP